jgi:hypothetical protein
LRGWSGTFDLNRGRQPSSTLSQPLVVITAPMLRLHRLFTFWQAAANRRSSWRDGGESARIRGGSGAPGARRTDLRGRDPELHVVDTFEGHLDATLTAHDPDLAALASSPA